MGTGDQSCPAYGLRTEELVSACQVLFGPEVEVGPDFLGYLQPDGAKNAYRQRIRERHPDAHPQASHDQLQYLHRQFLSLSSAYELLQSYFVRRGQNTKKQRASTQYSSAVKQPYRAGKETRSEEQEIFYRGAIPQVELKIGRYLYFRGKVSFQSVLRALHWQRMQRPSVGQLARCWGWLSDTEVHLILQAESVNGRFGERARRLGLLSTEQVQELLAGQRTVQQRLGSYFVNLGLLNELQLLMLEHERIVHNDLVSGRAC